MPRPEGVWVVYYPDKSGAWVFSSELQALRHAVECSASVHFVPFGCDVFHPERED